MGAKAGMTDVVTEIREKLFALQDIPYRDFNASLIPGLSPNATIGVRTPALRALAKQLKGTPDADVFLHTLPHRYQEENSLHTFLICEMKDYSMAMDAVEAFLPYVDNWAICDSLSPKVFKRFPEPLYLQIPGWLASDHTYTVRFGIKMLMTFFLDAEFKPECPELVAAIRSEEYYINMMIAWYFATALAKQYDTIIPYIRERRLDRWTHNKTIQKAVESYRITPEQKDYLRSLRWKDS